MEKRSPLEDMSPIHGLVARARARLRAQAALEGATTALVPAAAVALLGVFLTRLGLADAWLIALAPAIVLAGALVGALRRVDDEVVARRIDRASNLADRLSTAIAFERLLAQPIDDVDAETRELMAAAVRDAVRVAPRANIVAASPFRRPRDLRAALGFVAVAALTAGIALPTEDRTPRLLAAFPDHAPPGASVVLRGRHLGGPSSADRTVSKVPGDVSVYLGAGERAVPVAIESWRSDEIKVRLPETAALGPTTLTAYRGRTSTGPLAFTVVDPADPTFHREDAVALDQDDLDYVRDLLRDMKHVAKTDDAKALDEFAAKLEKLLEQAEKGELTKEQLLAKVDEAFEELSKGVEPDPTQVDKDLEETGKQLEKNPTTEELGKALAQGDLEKAKQELEKLADKVEKNELTPEQKQQAAQAMEKAAEAFDKKEQQRDQAQQQKQQDLEEQVRKLEKKKDQAKTPQEQQEAERQLEKKKRELKQLEKDKKDQQDSEQRRALKRLHKDMDKAGKQMQQKPSDQQDQQQQDQQASRTLRDVARETGKVDQDQRKQAAQKKVASQMEDLREALRRAKRRGSKGPGDPFGKNKQSEFSRRAQGKKGSRQAWKPGQQGQQGQGQPGQNGQGQPGQNGQGQQGSTYGDEHDPNFTGDATDKSGNTEDESLSGLHGKGSSRRETILSAAQKGFASRGYQQVFADYKQIVEEVMRAEKVPASYKFYVKKYFNNIKPHAVDSTD